MALENLHTWNIVWAMSNASELRAGRHLVFKLHVHLVYATRYRRSVITDRVRAFLKEAMERVCLDFEAELMAFAGEDDPVHLLIAYPPKVSISALVKSLKGASAYRLRAQKFTEVQQKRWGEHFWNPSCCAVSCGGAELETVKATIQDQRKIQKGTA
jgi:putative transposase